MSSIISENIFGFEYNHWLAQKMAALLNTLMRSRGNGLPSVESIRKVKVSNFVITPGHVMCRVQNGSGAAIKVEIVFKEFDFQTWGKIISATASNAYMVSRLYLGELPPELEEIFLNNNASLIPPDINGMSIFQDGKEIDKINYYGVAVLEKLASRFEEDPFAVFLLRGYEKDDFISELCKVRTNLQKQYIAKFKESAPNSSRTQDFTKDNQGQHHDGAKENNAESNVFECSDKIGEIDNYWKCGEDISKLKFSIKADDLPASILKWLDPLPLNGLESKINYQLEEIYAHVAKRAHSFGLGL